MIKDYKVSIFANVSHQTRLDTRSKARRPIKVGIKGGERSGIWVLLPCVCNAKFRGVFFLFYFFCNASYTYFRGLF